MMPAPAEGVPKIKAKEFVGQGFDSDCRGGSNIPKRHLFIAPISRRLFLSAFPSLFIVSADEKIDIFFHVFVRAARRLSIVAAVP